MIRDGMMDDGVVTRVGEEVEGGSSHSSKYVTFSVLT